MTIGLRALRHVENHAVVGYDFGMGAGASNMFMDPEKMHAVAVGALFLICGAAAVMGFMVTGHTRAEGEGGGILYIVGGILVFLVGWALIDYEWYPHYQAMGFTAYSKFCGMRLLRIIAKAVKPITSLI